MQRNIGTMGMAVSLLVAGLGGCGAASNNSPPPAAVNAVTETPAAAPAQENAPSPAGPIVAGESATLKAEAGEKTTVPAETTQQQTAAKPTPAPREPALAAEVVRVIDLRNLPRINTTQVLDDTATYVYYWAQGSVASAKAFYTAELDSQGWKNIPTRIPESTQYADHLYQKSNYYLRVSIGTGSEEGTVGVSLSSLGNFDMAALPRVGDAEVLDASTPVNVNFRTAQSILDVAKQCRAELPKLGWQEYTDFNETDISVPHVKTLRFRQNAVRMMVSISSNPQQASEKVHVAYMAEAALPYDLPVIADGSQLKIETYTGRAEYVTAEPVNELAKFYQQPDSKLGWKVREQGNVVGDESASLFVEDEPENGFGIQLVRKDDQTKVSFQRLNFKETPEATAPPPTTVATNEPPPETAPDPTEDAVAKALKEAQATLETELKKLDSNGDLSKLGSELEKLGVKLPGGVLGGDEKPAAKSNQKKQSQTSNTDAVAAADTKPNVCQCKVYFGEKTYDLTHVLAIQRTEFDEPTTVLFLGERPLKEAKLKTADWEDLSIFELTGFDSGASMQLTLRKGSVSVSCFIDSNSVNLSSSDIKDETKLKANRVVGKVYLAEPEDFFDTPFRFELTVDAVLLSEDDRPAEPAGGELTANSDYDQPVPEGCSNVSKESSPYREVIDAMIEADLPQVLVFYRAELTKRGWKEDETSSKVADDSAQLAFRGDQGALTLKLTREDEQTHIQLATRNEQLAKEHGILPKAGKALLMLGNANDKDVVIVIDQQEHKLAAGQGERDLAEAKKVDVAPGKHTVTVKTAGADPDTQEIEIEAGSAWGVIAFPGGGAFVAQTY